MRNQRFPGGNGPGGSSATTDALLGDIKNLLTTVEATQRLAREFNEVFVKHDASGNFYSRIRTYDEGAGGYSTEIYELDGVTLVAPVPTAPFSPVSASDGLKTDVVEFEGTGVNAAYPDGTAFTRMQLLDTSTTPATITSTIWRNSITGVVVPAPAANEVAKNTGQVDELLAQLEARLTNIETAIGNPGDAPDEAGSITAQMRQLIDETQKRYQVVRREVEITTAIPALNMDVGNTIEWFATLDMETDIVIRASLLNIDNPGDAFTFIPLADPNYDVFRNQPENWEAGPASTMVLEDTRTLLTEIRATMGSIGDAASDSGSVTALLRQLVNEARSRYVQDKTEFEITTAIPALNMDVGNTIEQYIISDLTTGGLVQSSFLINKDKSPGDAFYFISGPPAPDPEYATFIAATGSWEAGPVSTSIIEDTNTLLTDIKTILGDSFGAVGDPANAAGTLHAQLAAIYQAVNENFEIVKREAVYTAIQNNATAGITDGLQYQIQEWSNGNTDLAYRTIWTNLETGVALTPAQINAIDIPNDFDPNPIAITTSVPYTPHDWVVLPLAGDAASGLGRGAIARELVSKNAQVDPPIWINPDTDVALPAAPDRGNLGDSDAGFPAPTTIRYQEIGGSTDLRAYMIMFPHSDGFEVFSDLNITSQLTVGTTAGNVDETTIIPWDGWLSEQDRAVQGELAQVPADLTTLQATPATPYSHTQLLKAILVAVGTDLDNTSTFYLAGADETIGTETLLANSTPLIRITNEQETKWYTDAVPRVELATPPTDPILVGGGSSNAPVAIQWTQVNFIAGNAANNNFVIGTSIEYSIFARTNATRFTVDGVQFRRAYPSIDAAFIPGRLNSPVAVEITAGSLIYGRRI